MAFMGMKKSILYRDDSLAKNLANEVSDHLGDAWVTLQEGVLWNSSARIETNKKTKKLEVVGNVTEQGIYKFFNNKMGWERMVDKKNELGDIREKILTVPFDSERKKGS